MSGILSPANPLVVPGVRQAGADRARYGARDIAAALGRSAPTPEQCAVIEAPLSPMLVVAGAGSGKTETMAARVVWLVANGYVAPEQVLGLTFTRKAAAELADRVRTRLRRLVEAGLVTVPAPDDGGDLPTTSTYHAYAGGLVADHGLRLGVEPHARLLTEAGCWQLAHEVVTAYDGPMDGVDYAESTVTAAVVALSAELTEHLREPGELEQELAEIETRVTQLPRGSTRAKAYPAEVRTLLRSVAARRALVPLLEAYRRAKQERDYLDFSDQVGYAAALAARIDAVGALERSRYQVVLLDEFQDTSEAQLRLLRDLFAPSGEQHRSCVTAVGDPNQAIYGWRGASAGTLSRFSREFGTTDQPVVIRPLSTSWRNAEDVLSVANTVAAPLREASLVPVERLVPAPGADRGVVTAARLETVEDETEYVADWVLRHWQCNRSVAVLCRRRAQFPGVVAALRDRELPIEIVGLGGLLTTAEVADLVALLTVVHDPGRGDALLRLLTGPALRLGAADLDGLAAWSRSLASRRRGRDDGAQPAAAERPETFDAPSIVEALDEMPPAGWHGPEGERIAPLARERLAWLRRVIRHLRGMTGHALPDLVAEAERAIGLDIEVLCDPRIPFDQARVHLDAFTDVAVSFAGTTDGPVLGAFLAWLEAAEEHERGLERPVTTVNDGAVQVMTVHAAKGLEWDAVAVPGLVESAFPNHCAHRPAWNGRSWAVSEPKDRGWCSALQTLPHDLRGDCEALPSLRWRDAEDLTDLERRLVEQAEDGGRHALAEERRLAYVAVTRARSDLLLTASAWSSTGTLRVPSRFLSEAVAVPSSPTATTVRRGPWTADPEPDPAGHAVPPHRPAQPPVIWPVPGDPQLRTAYERAACRVDAVRTGIIGRAAGQRSPLTIGDLRDVLGDEITALVLERNLGDADARASVGLRDDADHVAGDGAVVADLGALGQGHVTSTDLVTLSDDPHRYVRDRRRPIPRPGVATERLGTDFHAWVEQHFGMAAILDVDDVPGRSDVAREDLAMAAMKDAFLGSEWSSRVPVAIELPVETVIADVPVRARIDALFRDPDGCLVVVDWKTGASPTGRRAASAAVQLGVYRLAVARLYGLEPQRVRAAFFYASTGDTIYPDVPDEARLTELLCQPLPRFPSGRDEFGEPGA